MSTSKKHAKFSASASHRWLHCPGSIALSEKAPAQAESPYAAEGTQAHGLLEVFLRSQKPDSEVFLQKNKYPKDMINHAYDAFKIIKKRQSKTAELLVETKVDLSFVYPDTFGTVDAALVEEFGALDVIDFKYGAGIPVDPTENPQLIFYALGLAHQYDYNFSHINLVIIQPRATQAGDTVREAQLSIADLKAWKQRFIDGVVAANKKSAALQAGEWCRFCPAATICPEISTQAIKQAQIDFDVENQEVSIPDVRSLTPQLLGQTLDLVDRLEFWIKSLRAHAFELLQRGEPVPGWKLVPKRASRKWEDLEKVSALAQKHFGEKAFDKKLLTPAQFEKKLDAGFVDMYSVSISSGVTLAPFGDKRSAVNQVEEDFKDEF